MNKCARATPYSYIRRIIQRHICSFAFATSKYVMQKRTIISPEKEIESNLFELQVFLHCLCVRAITNAI